MSGPFAKDHIPKIKICGLTRSEEAEYLNEYKADYAGFVFYPPSKRNVTVDEAVKIADGLDASIKKVAVMVSPAVEDIEAIQNAHFADIIQIHKDLTPDVLMACRLPIWRAVNIKDNRTGTSVSDEVMDDYNSVPEDFRKMIEAILIDASDFGSGHTFDWDALSRDIEVLRTILKKNDVAFILAGGLNLANAAEGISLFHPDIVDVSSGVEGTSGKDKQKIADFVHAVRGDVNEQ